MLLYRPVLWVVRIRTGHSAGPHETISEEELPDASGTDRDFSRTQFGKLRTNKLNNVVQGFTSFEIENVHDL